MKHFCNVAMLRAEIECIRDKIGYDWENSFIVFVPCCKKANQPVIDRVPISELKTRNFYDICKSAWQKGPPKGFDTSVDAGCEAPICDWTETDLEAVEVCFSTACNAHCSFCEDNHKFVPELEELYYKCLDDLSKSPIQKIGLTVVGEPFFNKQKVFNFLESIDTSQCINRTINIKTNLLALNETDAKRLVDLSKKYFIWVSSSINGLDKNTIEKIQNVNVDFERLKNVASILFDGGILTGISCVILPETIWQLPLLKDKWNQYHTGLGDIVYPLVDLSNTDNHATIVSSSTEWKEYFNGKDVKTGLDV